MSPDRNLDTDSRRTAKTGTIKSRKRQRGMIEKKRMKEQTRPVNCHDINEEAGGSELSERGTRDFMPSETSGYQSSSRLPTALAASTPRACRPVYRGAMPGFQDSSSEVPSSISGPGSREHSCPPAFGKSDRFQNQCQRYQKQKFVPQLERRSVSPSSVSGQSAYYGYEGRGSGLDPESTQRPLSASPYTSTKSYFLNGEKSHYQHHRMENSDNVLKLDEKAKSAISHLSQIKETPSHFQCDLGQGFDFLKSSQKPKETLKSTKKLPEIPHLRESDLYRLIKCENYDVESATYLATEQRKTYKKPCPKQQKAQMSVRALMQAYTMQICGKEYPPLEHPDPEDISPELAAAMMFSQEKGIRMEDCPDKTITSLFPDEKPPYLVKIQRNSISVVDSRDQEDMIEKSASVPSEGVSDSVYTRTMRGKGNYGTYKSLDVDFAIGQSKREYVLLAQKPQRINKVQYRGGNTPSWFPGYFSAFPNEDGIKVVPSPSGLFHKAWVQSNPKNVPPGDIIVVD